MNKHTSLPDGSSPSIMEMKYTLFFKRWWHKLFSCPTFWSAKPAYACPKCSKSYRCYWDGNDIPGHGRDYCNKCAKELEALP